MSYAVILIYMLLTKHISMLAVMTIFKIMVIGKTVFLPMIINSAVNINVQLSFLQQKRYTLCMVIEQLKL